MPATTLASPFASLPPDAVGMPLYQAVKRSLLSAIDEGHYAAGQALPSESELAAAFGVSVGTLRKAVDDLAAEHIVVRRQGRGTFVARHTDDRFLRRFFHIERDDGRREPPRVELLSFERGRAGEDAARALKLGPGDPALLVEIRLLLQGSPVVHDRLTLPAAVFKGMTEKRLGDGLQALYRLYQTDFGVTVVRALDRARATSADRASARVLEVAPGTPLLQVRRTAVTFGDRPVEHRLSTINTAHHEYVPPAPGGEGHGENP